MKWAVAMAMLAEVLKTSPYASTEDLDAIETIVAEQSTRDRYRSELATLLQTYKALR
jgi:hypothetical protein